MPGTQRKNRWSADVTAHSDALDLEPKVFEKKSAGQIAASLKRSAEFERSAKIEPISVSDVDVDFLHESRRDETLPAERKQPSKQAKEKLRKPCSDAIHEAFRRTAVPSSSEGSPGGPREEEIS